MKKLLILPLLALALSAHAADTSVAQVTDTTTYITTTTVYHGSNPMVPQSDISYFNEDVFCNAYFKVSYSNEKLKWVEPVSSSDTDCDFGVALDWGGMINFTGRPIVNMVNIGMDLHLALAYANYKDGYENITLAPSRADQEGSEFHHLSAGVGVGPAVAVAPFAMFDNPLRYLTVKAFYHFTPSYSALLYKDASDDLATKGGFCLYKSFGIELGYRHLGLGIETVQGSAKYNDFDVKDILDNTWKKEKSEKQKIETPSFRFFIAYKF